MEAYAGIHLSDNKNNFDDFGNALFIMFAMFVGHDWVIIMFKFMEYSTTSSIYFVAVNIALNIIFLELLTAVVIEMFITVTEAKEREKNLAKGLEEDEDEHLIKQIQKYSKVDKNTSGEND